MSIFDFINILCRLSISSIFFVDFTNSICRFHHYSMWISSIFFVDFTNSICRFHQHSLSISPILYVDCQFHHYSMSISSIFYADSIVNFINILGRFHQYSLSISSIFYVDFINILCRFDCQFHQYSRSISPIFYVDFINILCRCHQYSMLILIAWRSTYTSTSFLTHSNPVFSNSNSDKSFSLPALIIFKVKIQSVHSNC
jgi:hypothetical protein